MLVKNVRKITMLPNQRMHASSKKRIAKLIRNMSAKGAISRHVGATPAETPRDGDSMVMRSPGHNHRLDREGRPRSAQPSGTTRPSARPAGRSESSSHRPLLDLGPPPRPSRP